MKTLGTPVRRPPAHDSTARTSDELLGKYLTRTSRFPGQLRVELSKTAQGKRHAEARHRSEGIIRPIDTIPVPTAPCTSSTGTTAHRTLKRHLRDSNRDHVHGRTIAAPRRPSLSWQPKIAGEPITVARIAEAEGDQIRQTRKIELGKHEAAQVIAWHQGVGAGATDAPIHANMLAQHCG